MFDLFSHLHDSLVLIFFPCCSCGQLKAGCDNYTSPSLIFSSPWRLMSHVLLEAALMSLTPAESCPCLCECWPPLHAERVVTGQLALSERKRGQKGGEGGSSALHLGNTKQAGREKETFSSQIRDIESEKDQKLGRN